MELIDYLIFVIIPAIVAVIVGLVILAFIESRIKNLCKEKNLPPYHAHLIRLIARYLMILIIILAVAGTFGISLGNLWISISTLVLGSLIALFASWSLLSNILATMIIMIWRPVNIGNLITIMPDNISGKVTDINMFFSKLETDDGNVIQVPNVSLVTKFLVIKSTNSENTNEKKNSE
jgi:small-conductance mechanosensitive channel